MEKEKEENLWRGDFFGEKKTEEENIQGRKIFEKGKYWFAMKKKNSEGKYHGEGKIAVD